MKIRERNEKLTKLKIFGKTNDLVGSSLLVRPLPSMVSLSLIPNLHSGIPDKYDFIATFPATCADKTCPKSIHRFTGRETHTKCLNVRYNATL